MKKLLTIILTICLFFSLSGCILEEVSLLYEENVKFNNFDIFINEIANCCFVSAYECEEYTKDYEILIPNEYNGMPIKYIGGYHGKGAPTPFFISVSNLINAPEGSKYCSIFHYVDDNEIPEKHSIENISFTLNIGKNIKSVNHVMMEDYYPHINDDGSITFYHPVVYINCSEDNKHFYSKNGKLYNKQTDELVTDFEYAE